MSKEDASNLPVITEMPVIEPGIWQALRGEIEKGIKESGERYYWLLGADLVRANPEQREAYEQALRHPPKVTDAAGIPRDPDATSATVLIVLRVLDMQAKKNGYQLPQLPSAINPSPALREFMPHAGGSELRLMDIAYRELLRVNPILGEIVDYIARGAPNERLWALTKSQVKRAAVWAYYGVKALIPR